MTDKAKSTTWEDVKRALQIENSEESNRTFEAIGARPLSLQQHASASNYVMLGITPQEFLKSHGGDTFDFHKLCEVFKKNICKDYEEELLLDSVSKAVQFCSIIIYTVGPESRSVKEKSNDKVWTFRFPYKTDEANPKLYMRTAYVSTFKNESSTYDMSWEVDVNYIVLSVKHASLLALQTLNRVTDLGAKLAPPQYILTPLCGAIFSRNDIGDIAKKLKTPVNVILKEMNSSCQSGGQYLDESTLTTAALAAIVGTKKLGAKGKTDERDQICGKIIKQYHAAKKEWVESKFVDLCEYATGGVPKGLEPSTLIKLYNDVKNTLEKKMKIRTAMAASRDTELEIEEGQLAGIYESVPDLHALTHVSDPSSGAQYKSLESVYGMDMTRALEESRTDEAAGYSRLPLASGTETPGISSRESSPTKTILRKPKDLKGTKQKGEKEVTTPPVAFYKAATSSKTVGYFTDINGKIISRVEAQPTQEEIDKMEAERMFYITRKDVIAEMKLLKEGRESDNDNVKDLVNNASNVNAMTKILKEIEWTPEDYVKAISPE